MDPRRLHQLLGGEDRRASAHLLRWLAAAAEPGYALAVQARNALYDTRLKRSSPLGRPTLSIGNLTTGGTGKTPMVIELARRLIALGHRPAVLLRGYRGRSAPSPSAADPQAPPPPRINRSDELDEYRQALAGSGLAAADPDRRRSARWVLHQDPGVSVFLLDDAFQHRRAEREVDLVLLDATEPFGFGRLLPRGLLREPLSALARADGVIITRVEALDERSLAALDERVAHYHGRPAIAHAVYEWAGLLDDEDREHPLDALAGARVVAACGVGRPESFERALRNHRVDLAHILTLPDHHAYRLADARNLVALARRESASAVILTGKDWTKLAKPWADVVAAEEAANRPTPRVLRPELRVSFPHGEAAVQALLEGLPRLDHGSSD